jgi:ATP-binding cassette subfamily C (CFTR/MRP) protein 4
MSFTIFLNRTAIFLCILTYVLTGNTVQSQYVYVLTSFYGMLRQNLTMFLPQGVTVLAETHVSVKRIQKFLLLDEIQTEKQTPLWDEGIQGREQKQK